MRLKRGTLVVVAGCVVAALAVGGGWHHRITSREEARRLCDAAVSLMAEDAPLTPSLREALGVPDSTQGKDAAIEFLLLESASLDGEASTGAFFWAGLHALDKDCQKAEAFLAKHYEATKDEEAGRILSRIRLDGCEGAAAAGIWSGKNVENELRQRIAPFLEKRAMPPDLSVEVISGSTLVEGFPCVVGVRVDATERERVVYLRDLASTFGRSSGFTLLLLDDRMEGPSGHEGFNPMGRSWPPEFDAPDPRVVRPGKPLVMWLDLAQLIVPATSIDNIARFPWVGSFPRPGGLGFAFVFNHPKATGAGIASARVRRTIPSEQAALNELAIDGTCRSWIPDTFFVDESVPDASLLPVETRRTVQLLGVMRSALRSGADGLVSIESVDRSEWGYLSELVAMVEYECLRETDRTGQAKALRRDSPEHWAEVFDMVDQGDGLVRRLRRVRDGEVDYIKQMGERQLRELNERLSREGSAQ